DALILRRLHDAAEDNGVRWDLVRRADAPERSTQDWTNLTPLVSQAVPKVEEEIAATTRSVPLEILGLLARYGHLEGMADRLRVHTMDDGPLTTCWILIPADEQSELPSVGGVPIPVLTPNERIRIPRPWLANAHRSAPREDAA